MTSVEQSISGLIQQVDEIRMELMRLRRLCREQEAENAELRRQLQERNSKSDRPTPIRPPSQAAMEAYTLSSEFKKKDR